MSKMPWGGKTQSSWCLQCFVNLFPLSEDFVALEVAYKFEAVLDELADFSFCFADFADVVNGALEEGVFQLDVKECVFDFSVSQLLHDIEFWAVLVVERSSSPVSEGVKVYLE